MRKIYNSIAFAVLTIGISFFIGCNKRMDEPQKQVPIGAVDGLFSVSDSLQVYFSQGNLQYQPSTGLWQFASSQYECLEQNDFVQIDETYEEWIDVFAWGTSGVDHGSVRYQPWSKSLNDSDYYAYGDSTCNLYDQTGWAEWGYNSIRNGGNQGRQWRTLTKDEWEYVFDKRITSSEARFVTAAIDGGHGRVYGVVLFPDDWDAGVYPFRQVNKKIIMGIDTNVISEVDWNALHYHYGLVFFPYYLRSGSYWSSSYYDKNDEYGVSCAYYASFAAGFVFVGGAEQRHSHCFVRLVKDAH